MIDFLIFILAIFLLWLGAESVTKAAIKIAKTLSLSESFIGLTIVAIGTSFPEIVISITGAVQNLRGEETSQIVLGNVIGSGMANLALILGILGIFKVIKLKKNELLLDMLMLVLSTTILYLVSLDGLITIQDGVLLILFYLIYLLFLNRQNLRKQTILFKKKQFKKKKLKKIKLAHLVQLALGLIILTKASQMVLDSGVILAEKLNINEMLVGILLVGLGSSLPELMVSLNAALKGSMALSLNNLIGSNILNVFLALGVSSTITTWEVDRQVVQFDIPYLLFTSIVAVLFLLSKNKFERNESLLMMALYTIFIVLKISGF
ncbi:MAG TPA: calcium/sodium antiporter [Candidatus Woesebacteria bacterium]|jgi:cation:H+ antiporter|nr:calcium/sodium antiporter [Candidatus Woesebacteria bacterium]HQO51225.1 calcium/sodium antiporter [Candidatus Woesebacteria bacterium]HUM57140.1 calcium/sodium antiporter [Candidatus Woesebacteria bacterium]